MAGIADKIPPEYIWCRDMQHSWDPDTATQKVVLNRRTDTRELWRTFKCMLCPMEKIQKLTPAGQPLNKDKYSPPPDWKIPGKKGFLSARERAQIRAANTKTFKKERGDKP